ncbi:MAG: acetolactate synthase [Alphaproteobacteria bacterium]|nr:acetolactate synthase [Alphaproteobacteria bacterium]
MTRRAADLLVDCLVAHGVDRVFCVPGESYLAVLDALVGRPEIDVVVARHEGGAGFMGVADAKLTMRPGVVFVSRGPGATNASIAVHVAQQDAVPFVLFIGQIERKDVGRRAFQEVDYRQTFADMAKHVEVVTDGNRVPEAIQRAFHLAQAGTPGPTVVVLPEDMLLDEVEAAVMLPKPAMSAHASADTVAEVAARIAGAERPAVIAGGLMRGAEGRAALIELAEASDTPVIAAFKQQDLFPNTHRLFGGHLGYMAPEDQVRLVGEADLVVALGTRLGDVTSQGYRLPMAGQALVHVYPDPLVAPLAVDPVVFARALAKAAPRRSNAKSDARARWAARLHGRHAGQAAWTPVEATDGVVFGHPVVALIDRLPDDAILITDAGNFSGWLHRHFPFSGRHRLLGVVAGAMGFGMPAAVAASLRFPGTPVVVLIGDGGFLMTGYELATAIRHRARFVAIVSNNGSYGTIRLHQEKHYPGRVSATDLANPDFAALARSFGATGLILARSADAADVVAQALAAEGPAVIDVRSSLEHISAFTTLSALAPAK